MTRKELHAKLESGSTLKALFHLSSGHKGYIFKADTFAVGKDIIYIPSVTRHGIPLDRPLKDEEDIRTVILHSYTGDDFMVACENKKELAKNLFQYCNWQQLAEAVTAMKFLNGSAPERVHITIFQAPFAALVEKGVYWQMHNLAEPFCGVVPAEYYLSVFNDEIDCPEHLSKDPEKRPAAILEHVFSVFNTTCPDGYAGRSLSVGDVVLLEGRHYLCAALGFVPVAFESSKPQTAVQAPRVCEIALPDGTKLRASAYDDTDYPGISINLVGTDGEHEVICFAEHNPEKPLGHRLCIGVYRAGEDEPNYYDSYNRKR